MTDMRKDRRAPASLKVKYKSATVDDFIEQFGTDVSRGGIFIKTKKPLETGALLKFEFQLQDGSAVIHGVGRVAWRRLEQAARPDLPAGMGIKFFKLSDHSRLVVERIESRFSRENSRYEQTDAAEFAPPLSAAPPPPSQSQSNESGAHRDPRPGRNSLGAGSGPLTMPPPPANSSIPPALADVPPSRFYAPTAPPPSPLPAAARAGFGPREPSGNVRGNLEAARSSNSLRSSRAGESQQSFARTRRDPASVELARELFGDIGGEGAGRGEPTNAGSGGRAVSGGAAKPPTSGGPRFGSGPATPASTALTTPPPSAYASSAPPVEMPRPAASASAAARSVKPSPVNRSPSIGPLVDEVTPAGLRGELEPIAPAAKPASASGRARASSGRPSKPAGNAGRAGASARAAASAPTDRPLKLQMRSLPPTAATPSERPGRSKLLLFVALATTLLLGGAAVFMLMQRNKAQEVAAAAPAPPVAPVAPPPAEAPPVQAEPSAAEPSAAEVAAAAEPTPEPGPPVSFLITSTPRGAEVLIAGKRSGWTPLRLSLPSNVPTEVELKLRGHETAKRALTPKAGMASEPFELRAFGYQLVVETEPPGANVTANKLAAVSPAPIDLPSVSGPVTVTAELDGYVRGSRVVRLDEWQESDGMMRLRFPLKLLARRKDSAALAAAPPAPGSVAPPPPTTPAAPVTPTAPATPTAEPPPPVLVLKPEPSSEPEAEAKPAPEAKAAPEPEAAKPAPEAKPEAEPEARSAPPPVPEAP